MMLPRRAGAGAGAGRAPARRRFASTISGDGSASQKNNNNHNHDDNGEVNPPSQPPQQQPPKLVWPTQPNPTPYQIFNFSKGEAYSKRRYYELCMIYHPDRYNHHVLPENVRVERFKLVVAANEVLSDEKRKWAYDRYGAGWNGQAGVGGRGSAGGTQQHDPESSYRARQRRKEEEDAGKPWWRRVDWGGREGFHDPHNNATWEDWERYYAWRDGPTATAGGSSSGSGSGSGGAGTSSTPLDQKPIFASNSTFIILLAVFSAVGGYATLTHAQTNGMEYIAQRDAMDENIRRDMARRKRDAEVLGDKEERVRNFLRIRDPYGELNSRGLVQEKYRRLLPDGQRELEAGEGKAGEEKGGGGGGGGGHKDGVIHDEGRMEGSGGGGGGGGGGAGHVDVVKT